MFLTRMAMSLYAYLLPLSLLGFVFPWICLALWYLAIVQGCAIYTTRSYLEDFCLRPYSSLGTEKPWYLDLWNASDAPSSNTRSQHTETIMISGIATIHTQMVLRRQAYDMAPHTIRTDELFTSLGMSHSLDVTIKLCTRLAYDFEDQLGDVTLDLAIQLDRFSFTFCWEKDIMNHALNTFVKSYAMLAPLSDSEDLTLPSILLFPGLHLMQLISQKSLWPWIPGPKLYSFEIKAELQFQKKRLIDEFTAALDRSDASFRTTGYSHNSNSSNRYLEAAIDHVTIHQQIVREMIDNSNTSLWRWTHQSEETANLERHYRLGQRVRGHLLLVQEAMEAYEIYSRRLRSDLQRYLQTMHWSPSFGFSPQGSLALPAHLLYQTHNVSFLSRGQSTEIDDDGDSRDVSHITPHAHVFLYDLDSIDDTRARKSRSEIAQLCKTQQNVMMDSDNLYTICMIYNLSANVSPLEDDPLSSV